MIKIEHDPTASRPFVPRTLCFVAGTRPEIIKIAPVLKRLTAPDCSYFKSLLLLTGQHREIADSAIASFGITGRFISYLPKFKNKGLHSSFAIMTDSLGRFFERMMPDMVIVQGDTVSTLAASVAASFHKVPVSHIEAGLRSNDLLSPFPEEFCRRMVSPIASFNFAPTKTAAKNLINCGVPKERILVTGNTVTDAVKMVLKGTEAPPAVSELIDPARKNILVTLHRRENQGRQMVKMFNSIGRLAENNPDKVNIIFPVHPSPAVKEALRKSDLHNFHNVRLIEPLDYLTMLHVMRSCYFIMTDSGGIVEEAPSFGVPVLILRDTTERPEAIWSNNARLTGTDPSDIYRDAKRLLTDRSFYNGMAVQSNPYGDGKASERIYRAFLYMFDFTGEEPKKFIFHRHMKGEKL
ncbi:MAG: UDP-N-acetylglucosamine 2-epimerase (non-hydrolyzing) [Candidatus Saganbacteria bacterium]|nr:UDP-N-acetylglucosamine 2-epimerase (non-hydrolyzing) [Candidatus Saganbacteria bacterium]